MNARDDYDVLIVGAGAAGCVAAINIDQSLRVLMIDRSPLPRDKSCAGMLKQEAFTILKKYGLPEEVLSHPRILTPRGIDISSRKTLTANWRYYNANRKKLDEWLLELAKSNPQVEVMEKTHLVDFKEEDRSITARIRSGAQVNDVSCQILVGADGASGVARRTLTGKSPKVAMALVRMVKVTGHLKEFVGFIGKDIPYYHWVAPKDDVVQVGAAFPDKESDLLAKFDRFCHEALEILGLETESMQPVRGHPLCMIDSASDVCLGDGRVILTGEAAGLIDLSIFEGITYALQSGEMCAAAINEDFGNPLPVYKASLKRTLRKVSRQILLHKIYRSKRLRLVVQRVMPEVRIERLQKR